MMVLEIKDRGEMPESLNSSFISLIPKVDHLDKFGDLRPISICNMLYKIVVKLISLRIKPLLSNYISQEQFGFLSNNHIHEVVGDAHDTFHSIKTKELNAFVLNINLAKSYDKVSWNFLQLIFLHIGFFYASTKWIMSCINTT